MLNNVENKQLNNEYYLFLILLKIDNWIMSMIFFNNIENKQLKNV